ncbi:MAG: hypothetical protein ACJA0N_001108 [Pseudohongiellaceae bacterium]|jgi:hypothetical protein
MTEKAKEVEINFFQVLDVFGGVMGKILVSDDEKRAEAAFDDLKQGKTLEVGEIRQSDKVKLNCKIKLNHTGFKGPGFNYDIFSVALGGLLNRIGADLNAKKEIKLMHSEAGMQLVAIPGVVRANDQDNVLMIALEFSNDASVTAHLVFMDPEQFKQAAEKIAEQTEEVSAETGE